MYDFRVADNLESILEAALLVEERFAAIQRVEDFVQKATISSILNGLGKT